MKRHRLTDPAPEHITRIASMKPRRRSDAIIALAHYIEHLRVMRHDTVRATDAQLYRFQQLQMRCKQLGILPAYTKQQIREYISNGRTFTKPAATPAGSLR